MTLDSEAARRSLLGLAVGDSLGLPYEGLKNGRGLRLMPLPLRQRLLLGRWGSTSDDAALAALTLGALLRHPDDEPAGAADFARGLRRWSLTLPPGIGLSTAKACLRLLVGFGPARSGVPSGGNGAAMRAAPLGAALKDDPEPRARLVLANARVTHTHPLALAGASLVALAAALAANGREADFDAEAPRLLSDLKLDWPWGAEPPPGGPTGFVVPTVNAALEVWRAYPHDLRGAIEAAVALGGDTDTVAAIVGGIVGASPQTPPPPEEWLRFRGWPAPSDMAGNLRLPYPRLLLHHLTVLPVVLLYGFRRLLPPY